MDATHILKDEIHALQLQLVTMDHELRQVSSPVPLITLGVGFVMLCISLYYYEQIIGGFSIMAMVWGFVTLKDNKTKLDRLESDMSVVQTNLRNKEAELRVLQSNNTN